MAYLLDTGILLRLVDESDSIHPIVQQAVDGLVARQEALYITTQNFSEFWNVATRPVVNNGMELPPDDVARAYEQAIEPTCSVLLELAPLHDEFKRLLIKYAVVGKQVHDTRLVAMMLTWQIENLLTLNARNFRRFEPEGIMIVSPQSLGLRGQLP